MTDEKNWYESKTIWGAIIAIVASLSGILGVNINAAAQTMMVDAVIQTVGGIGALLALYGRLSATDVIR